jgi:alpha-glucosidase
MSRTGLPMMRPLFFEFPNGALDGKPLDETDSNSFMLGASLLIADSPYPDTLDNYAVALPPVGWYNYWTGARVEGSAGRTAIDNTKVQQPEVTIHPSIDTLPVFVRAGSIIPEQPLVQSTSEKPEGPLSLRVYPPVKAGGECSGSFYLDDGVSTAYQNGEVLRMHFECLQNSNGMTLTVSPHEGSFGAWWNQLSVEVYGASHEAKSARTAAGPVATSYDSEHRRILAVVPDDGKGLVLKVEY